MPTQTGLPDEARLLPPVTGEDTSQVCGETAVHFGGKQKWILGGNSSEVWGETTVKSGIEQYWSLGLNSSEVRDLTEVSMKENSSGLEFNSSEDKGLTVHKSGV